jgi:phosphomannomutase
MMEVDAMIGGEESGGYAFQNHVPERDGILAGLYLLDMMVQTGKKPSQLLDMLFEKVGAHYYDRIDTRFDQSQTAVVRAKVAAAKPETIGGLKCTGISTLDGFQFLMEDGGWLLVRFSGTEPIIRVYCETTHQDRVQAILDDGMRIAGLR